MWSKIKNTLCATFFVLLVILGAGNVDLLVTEAVAQNLVVVDFSLDAVFRVDPVTGARVIISQSGTAGSGPGFAIPNSIAVESDGSLVVINQTLDAVFRVDPVTGARVIISKSGTAGSGPGFATPRGPAVEPVLDPEVIVDDTMDEVDDLVDSEILNGGQGNALVKKLEKALADIDNGKIKKATNKLNAFINQVNSFIDNGELTEEEGQPLIDAATSAIDKLNE